MSKAVRIILNAKKMIGEVEHKEGTVMGEVNLAKSFTAEDIDIAMQLGEVKIISQEITEPKNDKPKPGKNK